MAKERVLGGSLPTRGALARCIFNSEWWLLPRQATNCPLLRPASDRPNADLHGKKGRHMILTKISEKRKYGIPDQADEGSASLTEVRTRSTQDDATKLPQDLNRRRNKIVRNGKNKVSNRTISMKRQVEGEENIDGTAPRCERASKPTLG